MPRIKKAVSTPIDPDQMQAVQISGIRLVTTNRVMGLEAGLEENDLAYRFLNWITTQREELFYEFARHEVLGE